MICLHVFVGIYLFILSALCGRVCFGVGIGHHCYIMERKGRLTQLPCVKFFIFLFIYIC